MTKYQITDNHFLDQVKQWLELDNEIYVNIFFPRTGGGSPSFLLVSYSEFVQVLSHVQNRIGEMTGVCFISVKTVPKVGANDQIFSTKPSGRSFCQLI